jgi:hypothetical protein
VDRWIAVRLLRLHADSNPGCNPCLDEEGAHRPWLGGRTVVEAEVQTKGALQRAIETVVQPTYPVPNPISPPIAIAFAVWIDICPWNGGLSDGCQIVRLMQPRLQPMPRRGAHRPWLGGRIVIEAEPKTVDALQRAIGTVVEPTTIPPHIITYSVRCLDRLNSLGKVVCRTAATNAVYSNPGSKTCLNGRTHTGHGSVDGPSLRRRSSPGMH